MVGNLAHHVIDYEIAVAPFGARNQRQRFDHEGALLLGRPGPMLAQHSHWRIARIAVEYRELEWLGERGIPRGVFL